MAIIIHGKHAKKPAAKPDKKPPTPAENDAESKRIADLMYPTALEAAKAVAAAKGPAS
jgi:hypothetical protein